MYKILVIDDDENICHTLWRIAQREGHEAITVRTLAEGLALLDENAFDCVFLDVCLPDGNGLDAIPGIKASPSLPEIVILTGFGNPDGAALAISNGAWSYLEKTSNIEQITLTLKQTLQYRERSRATPVCSLKLAGVVGESEPMRRMLDNLAQAAVSKANVLLLGDTGTGKELMARTIHENSDRSEKPFVVVDCATLQEHLVESLLFGHVKGAFTGAHETREGMIKQADGGTLFLDEVGELSPTLQKSFLRVLQEHRFRSVGGNREVTSDFRLIAATNKNLKQMCTEGTFRQDLFFRLKTFIIELPPLAGRTADILSLVSYHVARQCDGYGIPLKGVSPGVMACLVQYDWPGNIRELIHVLERMVIAAADSPVLYPEHLPLELRVWMAQDSVGITTSTSTQQTVAIEKIDGAMRIKLNEGWPFPTFKEHREALHAEGDKAYLELLLQHAGGSLKRAYEIADLSRSRLYILLKRHGIRN